MTPPQTALLDRQEQRYNNAVQALNEAADALDAAPDDITNDDLNELNSVATAAAENVEREKTTLDERRAIQRAREVHTPLVGAPPSRVTSEPDAYNPGRPMAFMKDLYRSTMKNDRAAGDRINRHHDCVFIRARQWLLRS